MYIIKKKAPVEATLAAYIRVLFAIIYINITYRKMDSKDSKKYNKDSMFKGWFCTWPHCPLSKEDALEMLKTAKLPEIVEYVIAEELHADGQPHLHAFIKLAKKVRFAQAAFDLGEYHGHYEPAKSWKAVAAYCKKEGNYIANFDLDSARAKKASHNAKLLELDPKKAVDDGYIGLCALPMLLKAKRAYANLDDVPDVLERDCWWIHGPAGAGKSYACRVAFPGLYCKPQNKWWDGYNGESVVLMDDFDKTGACLAHYMKIWADGYSFNAEIKGGMVRPRYDTLLVTSNYLPEDIFTDDAELVAAIRRRFKVIALDDRAGQAALIQKIRPENN